MDNSVDESVEVEYEWKDHYRYDYRKLKNGTFEKRHHITAVGSRWKLWSFSSVDYWEFIPTWLPDYVIADLQADRLSRGLDALPTKEAFDATITFSSRNGNTEYRLLTNGEWVVKDHGAGGGPPKPVDFTRWDNQSTISGTDWVKEMIPAINADRERRGVDCRMMTREEYDDRISRILQKENENYLKRKEAIERKEWREVTMPKALGFHDHHARERALREFIESVLMDRGLIERPADEGPDVIPPKTYFD